MKQGIRGSRPELVMAVAYVAVRVAAFVGIGPTRAPDSVSYLEVARLDPLSSAFLAGPRAPAVPLFYKVLGSDELRVIGQLTVSILSWLALAAALAMWVERRSLRAVAFGSSLLFSLAPQITHWDSILLAESLSVSLTAATIAAWLWFVRGSTWPRLAAVAAVSLAWVFTRDTNAYLVGLVGLALLAAAPFVTKRRVTLAAAAVMIAIFGLSLASADGGATGGERAAALAGQPDGSFGRTAEAYRFPAQQYFLFSDGRWEFPLLNVIGRRVLTDPGRLRYFEDHGMPVTPALMQMAGEYAPGRGGAFYRSPRLASFRRWLVDEGSSTYTTYLLTHPGHLLRAFTAEPQTMLFAAETLPEGETGGAIRESVRNVLPEPLRRVLLAPSTLSKAFWLAFGAAAIFLGVTRVPRWTWIVPIALIVSTLPHMIVVWHGDSQELQRHALLIGVLGRLGILMLLFLALDSPRRKRRRAMPADRHAADEGAPVEPREAVGSTANGG